MTKKTILLLSAALVGGLGLAGCQQQATRDSAPEMAAKSAAPASSGNAAYDQALGAAKAAIKEAGSHGGEWRDTGKILKSAEKAAEAGDYEKAINLANTAKYQAEAGKSQAMQEQNVGNPGYLY